MNDNEILDWLDLMGTNHRKSKREVVEDLIANAKEDEMSPEDMVICQRGLELLAERGE